MPPQQIQFGTLSLDFKKALREVIAPYFNGGTHIISDRSILFPLVTKIEFYNPFDNTPKDITVGFSQRPSIKSKKHRINNPSVTGQPGIETRSLLNLDMFVTGPRDVPNVTLTHLHKVWDCMVAVLHFSTQSLSERGIFQMDVDEVPALAIPKEQSTLLIMGQSSCEFRYQYATFNS